MTMIPTFTSLIIIFLIQLSYVSFILYHRQVIFGYYNHIFIFNSDLHVNEANIFFISDFHSPQ